MESTLELRKRIHFNETGFCHEVCKHLSVIEASFYQAKKDQKKSKPSKASDRKQRKLARQAQQHEKKVRNSLYALEPSLRR